MPENLHAWYAVAPQLAENYHVLALDWPGFGGSDPFPSPADYTSRHFAEVIVDFMDSLQINQASLVATDIALLPSLLVGLEHPDRVTRLAVMDGIPFARPQYSSWELRSFAKKGSILGKALVRWFPGVTAQISYLKGFYRGHSIPAEVLKEFAADGVVASNQEAFLSYFQNFHLDVKRLVLARHVDRELVRGLLAHRVALDSSRRLPVHGEAPVARGAPVLGGLRAAVRIDLHDELLRRDRDRLHPPVLALLTQTAVDLEMAQLTVGGGGGRAG